MTDRPITKEEFRERLQALCLSGGGRGLPRKHRDRHILFRSVAQMLDSGCRYTEQAINEALDSWLADVGHKIELDRVSLRRDLVDAGYLVRDLAGHEYRVLPDGRGVVQFDQSVNSVDPSAMLRAAQKHADIQKHERLILKENTPT
jgi:hypothetical protein